MQIGLVGNTGLSFGAHLHFQVNRNGSRQHYYNYNNVINPIYFFPNIVFDGDTSIYTPEYLLLLPQDNGLSEFFNQQESIIIFDPTIDIALPEYFHEIDISLVDYVGEELVLDWINNGVENKTINDFRDYFNIDDATFTSLCEENNLTNYYNVDTILSDRSISVENENTK